MSELNPVRVIVAGPRDYENRKIIYKTLDSVLKAMPGFELVSGKEKGVQLHAFEWADLNDVTVKEIIANWKDINVEGADVVEGAYGPYNRKAGVANTRAMIAYASHVIAFWDGTETGDIGTKIMIELARKAGLKVKVFIISGDEIRPQDGGSNNPEQMPAPTPEPVTEEGSGFTDNNDLF